LYNNVRMSRSPAKVKKSTPTAGTARVSGVKIVKPIVYGCASWSLPKSHLVNDRTHGWKLYVKPYFEENLQLFIRKISFTLHSSFAEPTRICSEPPYEVNETGWGEFKAVIKIYFKNSCERPVTIYQTVKLFSEKGVDYTIKKPLIDERYDEIVFRNPCANMYSGLMDAEESPKKIGHHAHDYEQKRKEILENIQKARQDVQKEVSLLEGIVRKYEDALEKAKM
ncbi:YEATS domain-containing protein 4, partial [Trichinella patagoniensis]